MLGAREIAEKYSEKCLALMEEELKAVIDYSRTLNEIESWSLVSPMFYNMINIYMEGAAQNLDKAEKLSVALHDRTALMDEYTAQIEEKEKNIKYLNMLLHEKTKEILSLERIVNRYHENEQILKSSYNRLAVENQNIKLGHDEKAPPPPNNSNIPNENIQITTATINPIFLGNA